jgi:Flp pilus assembly protein TadB
MPEGAAAVGLAVAIIVLAVLLPVESRPGLGRLGRKLRSRWEREAALAAGAGWRIGPGRLAGLQGVAGMLGLVAGLYITALPVLGLVAALGAAGGVRLAALMKVAARRRARQDAVLEAVRLLRQLLETGGVGVQQAIAVLAERGPEILRSEFRAIVTAGVSGRQGDAWAEAKVRVAEPVFDLLAAAIAVQRPAGGRLGPLFADLEDSVTALYEVVREGEALQVQARSTAIFILALPLVFLAFLAATRSPYLDVYRAPVGEVFLALMLGVMGASYVWIRRWLALPEPPRLRLSDG